MRANDEGEFNQNYNNWPTFHFYGRSVFNLRMQVGIRQPGGEYGDGITLAVRPGLQGRLTPLVTDLPRSEEPMDVVVLTTGSPGDNLLSSSHLILSVACSGLVICSSSSDCESMFSPLVGF